VPSSIPCHFVPWAPFFFRSAGEVESAKIYALRPQFCYSKQMSYRNFLKRFVGVIVRHTEDYGLIGILVCHAVAGFFIVGLPAAVGLSAEWIFGASSGGAIAALPLILFASLPVFPLVVVTTFLFVEWLGMMLGVYGWLGIKPNAARNALGAWSATKII
jgi:hypothetical protein